MLHAPKRDFLGLGVVVPRAAAKSISCTWDSNTAEAMAMKHGFELANAAGFTPFWYKVIVWR
uniref:Uncharacterized protein n=1 Tax=Manihot esculenta TaxID=3983 RepID=A0A2C9WG43_MANES